MFSDIFTIESGTPRTRLNNQENKVSTQKRSVLTRSERKPLADRTPCSKKTLQFADTPNAAIASIKTSLFSQPKSNAANFTRSTRLPYKTDNRIQAPTVLRSKASEREFLKSSRLDYDYDYDYDNNEKHNCFVEPLISDTLLVIAPDFDVPFSSYDPSQSRVPLDDNELPDFLSEF